MTVSLFQHRLLSEGETRDLILAAQAGDRWSRDRVILHNQALVRTTARRYLFSQHSLDDLIGWGNVGLILAVDGFDLGFPARFADYAARAIANRIRAHIFDYPHWLGKYMRKYIRLRRFSNLGHEEIVAALGMREGSRASLEAALLLDEMVPFCLRSDDRIVLSDGMRERAEDWEYFQMMVGKLDPQRRDCLRLQYLEGWTQDRIARKYGCTRQNVSHHVRSAVAQLAALARAEA
jgi:RNA polymerase sigma factor (sigma-70 family)